MLKIDAAVAKMFKYGTAQMENNDGEEESITEEG